MSHAYFIPPGRYHRRLGKPAMVLFPIVTEVHRRATGARYLADAFSAYGVTAVFFVPTMLSRTLFEMEQDTDIKRIVSHGEKASAYMADGYARASGRVGVCFAQNIGATNL